MNRRQFLHGTVGAFICEAVAPKSAVLAKPLLEKPKLPVFAVGTDDEFNWEFIPAHNLDEALEEWLIEQGYGSQCVGVEFGEPLCSEKTEELCEYCMMQRRIDGFEVDAFRGRIDFNAGDWIAIGMGALCAECLEETSADAGAKLVGERVLCDECFLVQPTAETCA